MPIAQDMLSRIINVSWPGGNMLALYGFVAKSVSQPSAPDPQIGMTIHCPQLNLDEEDITEAIPGSFTQTDQRRPLWADGRFIEDYAHLTERDTETTEQSFHFLDRGRYGVQRGSTLVTSADNGTGGVAIPFTMDYTGNSSPDGDNPVFLSPPADVFNVAEDQATVAGLEGVGWLPVLLEELAGHDEVTEVTVKVVFKSRWFFIDLGKAKAQIGDDPELVLDLHVVFEGGTAEQSYGFIAQLGSYDKAVMDGNNEFTDGFPVDPARVWPLTEGIDPLDVGVDDFPNKGPAFFPPNEDGIPADTRFPADEPGYFEIVSGGTGESSKPPRRIRFHINMEDYSFTHEIIDDFEEP